MTDGVGRQYQMDRPPHDELGPDEDEIKQCDACGGYYTAGSWHYCSEGEHVGDVPEDVIDGVDGDILVASDGGEVIDDG